MPKWIWVLAVIVAIGFAFAGAKLLGAEPVVICGENCTLAACTEDYHCPLCSCIEQVCQ